MADIKPTTALVRQRKVMSIAALKATIERQKLEILEMDERRKKNEENIRASLEHIKQLEQELEKL